MANALLHEIDRRIAAKRLLDHPFYQAWSRGELSREALRDYAAQYYHHVAAFPTYLSAVHSNTDDQEARRQILMNLCDEEAGDPNHPELWLRFAESLGVGRDDVRSAELWPETIGLISTFRSVCREGSAADGLTALYAYESQIPEVCVSKIDGLRRHYGIVDPEAYRYFAVHVEADTEHAAQERALLENRLSPKEGKSSLEAADRVLTALQEMLSGVCRRHGNVCRQ